MTITLIMENGKSIKGNLVMARGKKLSQLYWTNALVARDSVNTIDMEKSLWHRRLSHNSEKGFNVFSKRDVLYGLENAGLEKCYHCMAGKQTRTSFNRHPPSRKSKLKVKRNTRKVSLIWVYKNKSIFKTNSIKQYHEQEK